MLNLFKILGLLVLALLVFGIAIRLLNPLPPLEPRAASRVLTATADTPLGRGAQAAASSHPGLSGIRPLNDGRSAFAARTLLARAAVRSLDVQYYIWKGDLSGSLLLHEMRAAADRGVRVRMLLDDNGVAGLDARLAAIDQHPNVEVRLFNPFVVRNPKMIGYLADFPRLNRRMHNKSFTADNQVTIIGGRNVGDEYFGAKDSGLFADLDGMAIGPAVADVSNDFDRYWSSASAYTVASILPSVKPERIEEIAAAAAAAARAPAARAYLDAIRTLPFVDEVQAGTLVFEWAPVRMVSDDPAKALGRAEQGSTVMAKLGRILGTPEREVSLVSGYFVPTQAGEDAFVRLAESGVEVKILSNALETTDVAIVHAGYAGRRKALLRGGVRLFEMRMLGGDGLELSGVGFVGSGSGSANGQGIGGPGSVLRSTASTLHAKTFAIDGRRIFIGSFNFDPRSMRLNTELGFVIDSRSLAAALLRSFATDIPLRAYEVQLTAEGDLVWIERDGRRIIRHVTEPGTSWTQQAMVTILSKLPIEWLL